MFSFRIVFPITLAALAGCAEVSPRKNFEAAQKAVIERTGTFARLDATDVEITNQVGELLKRPLTLENAAQIAVINNRTLRATFEDINISRAELLQVSRIANPTFSAGVRWPSSKPRGPDSEFSFVVNILDALFIPLKKKFAQAELGQAERRVAREVVVLITETKIALYTLQAHQMLREKLAAILASDDASADLAQRQFDAGNINRLELLNRQVPAQETRLAVAESDSQIQSDREAINRLLGLSGQQIDWKMAELLRPPSNAFPADRDFESIALKQRLDLEIARTQVAIARQAFKLKSSTRWLPVSINVGVDTEREAPGDRLTGPKLEVSLPLFNQGQGEVALLAAELARSENSYSALEINIRSEVRQKKAELIAAMAAWQYYEKTLLPQKKAIVQETMLHYNAMQKSGYELLGAKQQELLAERGAIDAQRKYWIASAEFEEALGGKLDFMVSSDTQSTQPILSP